MLAFPAASGRLAGGGARLAAAWLPVVAWTVSFGVATLSVHALKYRLKRRGPGRWAALAAPAALG